MSQFTRKRLSKNLTRGKSLINFNCHYYYYQGLINNLQSPLQNVNGGAPYSKRRRRNTVKGTNIYHFKVTKNIIFCVLLLFSDYHRFLPLKCLCMIPLPHKFSFYTIPKCLYFDYASRKPWLIFISTINSYGLFIIWNLNTPKRNLIFPFHVFRTRQWYLASIYWLLLTRLPTMVPISCVCGIEREGETLRGIVGYAEVFFIKTKSGQVSFFFFPLICKMWKMCAFTQII